MDFAPAAGLELSDAELVVQFESIGDNCEFGLLQRQVGVEPLGLLRFAGAPLRNVVRALNIQLAGIADPAAIRIDAENGEYMVKLTRHDFTYHAGVLIGELTPDIVHEQQCRTVRFLADKLLRDLRQAEKIFVFRQNEPLLAADLADLRIAMAAYGPNVLLWVQEACPGHPPGSAEVADERMIVGYVRRLARRHNVPDLDAESWLRMLRRAHALASTMVDRRLSRGTLPAIRQTTLTFGLDGNAQACLGTGWSGPEMGYNWAVGERSTLRLDSPGEADEYWLEMEVTPYLAPLLLPRQRLDVAIDGQWVHSFEDLPRGEVGCVVPSHLIAGQALVTLTFGHPDAASPMLVQGHRDDRRLAMAFHRLALRCA